MLSLPLLYFFVVLYFIYGTCTQQVLGKRGSWLLAFKVNLALYSSILPMATVLFAFNSITLYGILYLIPFVLGEILLILILRKGRHNIQWKPFQNSLGIFTFITAVGVLVLKTSVSSRLATFMN